MDSERRHELETNDLREFLDNFKDFWNKYGNPILITLIVVLGAFMGYTQYNKWQTDKADSTYTGLNEADSADAFRRLAAEQSRVHDEAMRRGGDIALGQARSALIAGNDETAKKALDSASSAYTAIAERGTTIEYQLAGHEGLAKIALMREQWDKAKTHYDDVIELASKTFVIQADRAQRALDRIDLLKNPVAFAPPEAAPEFAPIDSGADLLPELPPLPLPLPPAE